MVLLKGYDSSGFKFFTNQNSHKGRDLVRFVYFIHLYCDEFSSSYLCL